MSTLITAVNNFLDRSLQGAAGNNTSLQIKTILFVVFVFYILILVFNFIANMGALFESSSSSPNDIIDEIVADPNLNVIQIDRDATFDPEQEQEEPVQSSGGRIPSSCRKPGAFTDPWKDIDHVTEKVGRVTMKIAKDNAKNKQRWLDAHNRRRQGQKTMSGQSIPPLKWNQTLADQARRYTKKLVSQGRPMAHGDLTGPACKGPGNQCGQNMAMRAGSSTDPASSFISPEFSLYGWWDKERPCYTSVGARGSSSCQTGHYTQAAWKDAREVGCAMVNANPFPSYGMRSGGMAVCNYDIGNVYPEDNFKKNVPAPC